MTTQIAQAGSGLTIQLLRAKHIGDVNKRLEGIPRYAESLVNINNRLEAASKSGNRAEAANALRDAANMYRDAANEGIVTGQDATNARNIAGYFSAKADRVASGRALSIPKDLTGAYIEGGSISEFIFGKENKDLDNQVAALIEKVNPDGKLSSQEVNKKLKEAKVSEEVRELALVENGIEKKGLSAEKAVEEASRTIEASKNANIALGQ
jgi:hypothetical protein